MVERIEIKDIVLLKHGIACKNGNNINGEIHYYQMRDYDVEADTFVHNTTVTNVNNAVMKHLLCKKDLLITMKGSRYYCALYNPEKEEKAVASGAFLILKVIDSRITPEYLCWYLNRPEVSEKLIQWRRRWLFYFQKEMLNQLAIPSLDIVIQKCNYNMYKLEREALKVQQKLFDERQRLIFHLLHR